MVYITNQTSIGSEPQISIDVIFEYFKNKEFVQVDTETEGFFDFSNKVLLLQLGDYDEQFVINFQQLSKQDKTRIFDFLKDKTCIFANAKFDLLMLKREGYYLNKVVDVFLMSCLLNAGLDEENNLAAIVSKWAGVELPKNEQKSFHKGQKFFTDSQLKYAANDVKYLQICYDKMHQKLIDEGMANENPFDIYTVMGLEFAALHALVEMEWNGLMLDTAKWKEVKSRINQDISFIYKSIEDEIVASRQLQKYVVKTYDLFEGEKTAVSINWASPKQKLEVLKRLVPTLTGTDEKTLSKHKDVKLISLLLKLSSLAKLKTSFSDKMESYINPVTGRIHQDLWQILSTGRMSSSHPNMQQIPSRSELGGIMRSAFVAKPGYVMIGGDYSGCELRVIAELSQDPVWVNAFKEGKDLHSELCALTFGIPITDVKKPTPFKPDIKYRDVQKTINFGLAYGMSEFKLADTIEVSTDTAREIIAKFFKAVPKVEQFLSKCGKFSAKYLYSYTPVYKRRRYYSFDDTAKRRGEIERAGKNAPIQGANGDMTKLALVYIMQGIRNFEGAMIVHCVHDEIQCEVPKDIANEFKVFMQECMLKAANYILKETPMEIDCKISSCWSK